MHKNDRIYVRMSSAMKEELKSFADVKGMTISEFLISSAYKEAYKVYKLKD